MARINKTKLVSGKVTPEEKEAFALYCESRGKYESDIVREHVRQCIRLGAKRIPLSEYKPKPFNPDRK